MIFSSLVQWYGKATSSVEMIAPCDSASMLCFHPYCHERCLIKCFLYSIALSVSLLYILIQNDMLFKAENERIEETKLKATNKLGHTTRMSSHVKTTKPKFGVEKPLIYMHTKRLHTPLTYDETCEITRDPERFDESHAVVFHAKDLPMTQSLADLRSKAPFVDQLWVYFNLESPINTRKVPKNEMLFNLTVTPIRDSDIFHPYGYHYKKTGDDGDNYETEIVEKTNFIAWCVSNCKVQFRNDYVRLMQKYLTVDVYGTCSRMFGTKAVCQRDSSRCNRFLATYKFYLAFENSICNDYVTEKYWGALHRGNVPVVLSANNDLLIPGSFIDVNDFKTVKQLANYLSYLNENDDAYMKYFKWREDFGIDFLPNDARRTDIWLPQLCDFLQDVDWSQKKIVNISDFYGVEKRCPQDKQNNIMKIIGKGI